MENVKVGELSFLYDAPLKTYLLMFVDYSDKVPPLDLYSSSTPYGPFDGPEKLYPCGSDPNDTPRWMEKTWGGCYGGYMLPNSFGADGHDLSFALSVWIPYTTVLMTMRINTSSTTGSTSSASRSSMNTQTSTSIASRTTESTAGITQLSLGNQEYIIAITIVLAAAILAVAILKCSYQRHRQSSIPTRNQPGVVN